MTRVEEKTEFGHVSVLLEETIAALAIQPDGIYVDGTMGGAGHGYEICRRLSAKGRYIGIDRDAAAVAAGRDRLSDFQDRVTILHANYAEIGTLLPQAGITIGGVNGILLDLGVSSHQLDTKERGFSYQTDAPLDMRMDTRSPVTAAELINSYSEQELFRVIREYGEDPFAKNIAKHICRMRAEKPLETTGELVEAVRRAIPMKIQKGLGHPAKRTFQAIRIELNGELTALTYTLDTMIELLAPKGRLCVITFHSLEDRIVKQTFRRHANPCVCPPEFPVCACGKRPDGLVVTRKAILPSEEETTRNSRAKSAKLRVYEKSADES